MSGPIRAAAITHDREMAFVDIAQWTVFGSGGWTTVQNGRVRFFSADGREGTSLQLRGKEVLVSPVNSGVLGVLVYADQKPSELRVVQFDLYDDRGQKRLSLSNPGFSNAIVSPAGNGFVGLVGADEFPTMRLRFYDAQGRVQDSLTTRGFEGGRYAADGSRFFYVTAAAGLLVASPHGQVLDSIGRVETWGCSADGHIVASSLGSQLTFYRDGHRMGSMTWPGTEHVRTVAVSADGSQAAAVSAGWAAAIRLDSLKYLWTRQTDGADWNFRSIDVSDGGDRAVIGLDYDPGAASDQRHTKSKCLIVDAAGSLVDSVEGTPHAWGAAYPQARFLPSGKKIIFLDRDAARWLSINQ
ncbi:MAG: hypothetical protein HY304_05965 [candidate division Zixibacteria bacterium]|nr:hypothetical protein [candidate division Zixibacteria bacterium]